MDRSEVAQVVQAAPASDATRASRAQRAWRALRDHRWLLVTIAGALAVLLIFSRRPDALLNPQFLAEDGAYFYAQAYNLGPWHALVTPAAGYLVTSARLVAVIALLFPLAWGPLIFNFCAIVIQAAPVMFLLTDRLDHLFPSWYARLAIAFLYLAAPGSFELDAAMTYSQWHLAILAFLVIIAAPRSTAGWRLFDAAILALAALSGPFCFFLAPIVALRWLRTRAPLLPWLLAIDLIASGVQAALLITTVASSRAHGPLGVDSVELARIIIGQIVLVAAFSMKGYALVSLSGWWATGWFPALLLIAGLIFLAAALRRAPQELRLFWLFGGLVFAAALVSPVTNGDGTYWQRLAHPMWNARYEFFLMLAWLVTLVWVIRSPAAPLVRRVALIALAFACLVAIPVDWEYPPFQNYHYQTYVRRFERLPAGSRLVIPLNPPLMHPWTMTLIKH